MSLPNSSVRSRFAVIVSAACLGACAHTQKVTAFKVAEREFADSRSCVYDAAGKEVYRSVGLTERCPDHVTEPAPSRNVRATSATTKPVAMLTGETTTLTGKSCSYDFAGRPFSRAVGFDQRCPASIRVP